MNYNTASTVKALVSNPNFQVTALKYDVSLFGKGLNFTIDAYMPYTEKEPINELQNLCSEVQLTKTLSCTLADDIMNTTKLITQNHFIDAIKAGGNYIIGSVDNFGHISFAPNPAYHQNAASARAECKRLAKLSPGKLYLFVKLDGAEMVPANTISI